VNFRSNYLSCCYFSDFLDSLYKVQNALLFSVKTDFLWGRFKCNLESLLLELDMNTILSSNDL